MNKSLVDHILNILEETYPDAKCELEHGNSFELLIATVLSAQTTDKKVNEVTKRLFQTYKKPEEFLQLKIEELQEYIREIGLYKNKAKNIHNLCKMLIEDFNGVVPNKMEELIKLPGVGRKTANVVLSNAFDVPAIAVDTHVFRVSNRIGIAIADNVVQTENQLMKNISKKRWTKAHHLLIFHGRRICIARKPKCEICPIVNFCKYYKNIKI